MRWEYKVISPIPYRSDTLIVKLRELGKEGWELAGVIPPSIQSIDSALVFKRQM